MRTYTDAQARAAVAEIRRLRAEADDPGLPFFPELPDGSPDITDDVAAVVRYLAGPQRLPLAVRDDVRRAELPYRSVLVEWLRQQHEREYRERVIEHHRQILGVLDDGHDLNAPWSVYGTVLGYPTRQAVWNRRKALRDLLDAHDNPAADTPVTSSRAAGRDTGRSADPRVQRWLDEHARELAELAAEFGDHRDDLLMLLPPGHDREWLTEAVDQAGQSASRRPTAGTAGAIVYAMWLLRPDGPAAVSGDPILRDLLRRGTALRTSYNTACTSDG